MDIAEKARANHAGDNNCAQSVLCALCEYTDLDEKTWNSSDHILEEEFKIIKKLNFDGIMLYSINFLKSEACRAEVNNLMNEIK